MTNKKHNFDEINFSIPNIYPAGRRLANTNVRSHAHDFTEFILVTQGKCIMNLSDKVVVGQTGDLFVIPPYLSHTQIEKDYVGTSYIGFHHKAEIFDNSFRIISLQNEIFVTRWIEDIIDLHTIIYCDQSYSAVVTRLLEAITTRLKQIEKHQKANLMIHPKLQSAIEIIQKNLTDQISVEEIAEKVDLSSSYLTKLFKKSLGKGPIHYQQEKRMQLACKYLLNPYMTIKQVARKCGYDDVNFFIRLFRKRHKVSPGKWRKGFFDKSHTSDL